MQRTDTNRSRAYPESSLIPLILLYSSEGASSQNYISGDDS